MSLNNLRMPTKCCVPGCNAGSTVTQTQNDQEHTKLHFFRPTKELLVSWSHAIPRQFTLKTTHSVCSQHFSDDVIIKEDKFIINGESVVMPRLKWTLKPGSVPTIFPNLPSYLTKKTKARKPPVQRATPSSIGNVPNINNINIDNNVSTTINIDQDVMVSSSSTGGIREILVLEKRNTALKKSLALCRKKLKRSRKAVSELEDIVRNFKKDHSINISKCDLLQKEVIQTIIDKGSKTSTFGMRYPDNFLLECILFRIKSPKGYRHCRDHNLLPLPSPRSLSRLTTGLKCSFGVNEEAVKAISGYSKDSNDFGILVFDEVKLSQNVQLNHSSFKIDGFVDLGQYTPENQSMKMANHALVFMYVPLLQSWVQPVAVYASFNATPGHILSKLLLELVIYLENSSVKVLGFTCDGSQSNKSLWQTLGISGKINGLTNFIQNPCVPSRNLYALSDAVHIFKCIRNNFLLNTIKYEGEAVLFKFYRDVHELDQFNNNLKICPKLTETHLKPNSFQKMNARLVFQLFSKSVAEGVRVYRTVDPERFKGSEMTEKFTRDLNVLMDILNSKLPKDGLRDGSPQFDFLVAFLEKMCLPSLNNIASDRTMESLRVTLKSTIEIATFLFRRGFHYCLTAKLNQDPLERHFGIMRSISGDIHPSTTDFLHLHILQSIYVPIKTAISSNMNVASDIDVPVASMVTKFRELGKTKQIDSKLLKEKLTYLVKEKLEVVDMEILEGDKQPAELDIETDFNKAKCYITYYLSGYVIQRMNKLIDCVDCLNTLKSVTPLSDFSQLTEARDFGQVTNRIFLFHPSKSFFHFLCLLEEQIVLPENLQAQSFIDSLNNLGNLNVPSELCCSEEHLLKHMPQIVFFYLKCRYTFHVKEQSNNLRNASKSTRKVSCLK